MQYVLWVASFIGLWMTIVWLSILFLQDTDTKEKSLSTAQLPSVTIVVPVFNGKNVVLRTLESIKNLDYPPQKLETIVVDDGSSDTSAAVVQQFISLNQNMKVVLIRQAANKGKGASVNVALARASGDFFQVMDCDCRTEPNALRRMIACFHDVRVAAVIPTIKVETPRTAFEYGQRVEYIMSNLLRHLLSRMNTLFLTCAMAVFRTRVLRSVGGFDGNKQNLTEDLEIALRLRSKKYVTTMAYDAVAYTHVPKTFYAVWRQRERWFRGFLYNHNKYKSMIGNPDYGLFGLFQLPLNILGVLVLLVTTVFVTYGGLTNFWDFLARSLTINGYFWNHVLDFPTTKELLLGQDVQVVLPLMFGTALGIWLIVLAHKGVQEKVLRYAAHIWLYFLVSPYLTALHWLNSIFKELVRAKRKW